MNTDNEQEEIWLTEAKQCASEQADWFAEMIVEKVIDLNVDLDWYAKEVIKQMKNNLKTEWGRYEIRSERLFCR